MLVNTKVLEAVRLLLKAFPWLQSIVDRPMGATLTRSAGTNALKVGVVEAPLAGPASTLLMPWLSIPRFTVGFVVGVPVIAKLNTAGMLVAAATLCTVPVPNWFTVAFRKLTEPPPSASQTSTKSFAGSMGGVSGVCAVMNPSSANAVSIRLFMSDA
jgi:hypothetical protein